MAKDICLNNKWLDPMTEVYQDSWRYPIREEIDKLIYTLNELIQFEYELENRRTDEQEILSD